MLHLAAAPMGFSAAPALRPTLAAAPITMRQSEALPFLEAPPQLDGSMAGDVGFDPLNLSGYYSLDWMREAEIKHGRICMLAFLGYLAVDGGVLAPGAPQVSSFEAHDVTVKTGHMLLLLILIAIPEGLAYTAIQEMMSGESDRKPGDYGIGWKFCKPGDTATQEKYKLAEITHCRAAMLGFAGMVTQSAKLGMAGEYAGYPYIGGFEMSM